MSDYIPQEILHKILLKLPIKTLVQSTLVCKSWSSLIKSSPFIASHLRRSLNSNHHLLLLCATSPSAAYESLSHVTRQHFSLRLDSPDFAEHSQLNNPIVIDTKFNTRVMNLIVVGSCNGVVLLQKDDYYGSRSPRLAWNPSVKKMVNLPNPTCSFGTVDAFVFITHGFGYDASSNDYKILRVVTHLNSESTLRFEVYVFSLAQGSWKSLVAETIVVDEEMKYNWRGEKSAFVNGRLHMVDSCMCFAYCDDSEVVSSFRGDFNDDYITSFDLATEAFGKVKLPEAVMGREDCSVWRYGEDSKLALIKSKANMGDPNDTGCVVWVMEEYPVAESWSFLYNVDMTEPYVYGFKKCGELVVKEIGANGAMRTMCLDPRSNEVKEFGVEGYKYYFMDSFVESLVLLDHPDAISVMEEKEGGDECSLIDWSVILS